MKRQGFREINRPVAITSGFGEHSATVTTLIASPFVFISWL